jgi:hypothetical protein
VLGQRLNRRWRQARIAYRLHLNISTVHPFLARYLCPPLGFTDPAKGRPARHPGPDRAIRFYLTQWATINRFVYSQITPHETQGGLSSAFIRNAVAAPSAPRRQIQRYSRTTAALRSRTFITVLIAAGSN